MTAVAFADQLPRLLQPSRRPAIAGARSTGEFTGHFQKDALDHQMRSFVVAQKLFVQPSPERRERAAVECGGGIQTNAGKFVNTCKPCQFDFDYQLAPAASLKFFQVFLFRRVKK